MLQAAQHIYTNVERDRSPTKTAGFQTLFYTRDMLTEQDVYAIEERVFYRPGSETPPKRFFFVTGSNKWVIGQVVSVEGRDQAGRSGLYLAHSMIFSGDDLLSTGISPADLMQSVSFITTREEAFNLGDNKTGGINAIDVAVEPGTPARPDHSAFTRTLAQLAIRAGDLKAARKAVALIGSPANMEAALRVAYAVLPARYMPACTFDTAFDHGGNLSFTYCWATGHADAPHHPFFIRLLVNEKKAPEAEPATSYGRWVDAMLASEKGGAITEMREQACMASEYLDGLTVEEASLESIDEKILSSVLEANTTFFRERLRAQVAGFLEEPLVEKACNWSIGAMSWLERFRAARNGLPVETLLETLFRGYRESGFEPPLTESGEKDHREIEALVEATSNYGHVELRCLALCWQKDVVALRKEVALLDDEAYERAWPALVGSGQALPIWLLVKEKEVVFAAKIKNDYVLEPADTVYALGFFARRKKPELFDALIPGLVGLSDKQLRKAYKTISDFPEASESVKTAINEAMTKQNISPEDGLFKRWFGL